jgi:hypothetical protein
LIAFFPVSPRLDASPETPLAMVAHFRHFSSIFAHFDAKVRKRGVMRLLTLRERL